MAANSPSALGDEVFKAKVAEIAGILGIPSEPLPDPQKEQERQEELKKVAEKLRIAMSAREKAEGNLDFSRK